MNVYGDLAFVFKLFVRQKVTSWPKDVFVRRGERRRGTGSAMGVGVCEGIFVMLVVMSTVVNLVVDAAEN
jgi:hypothetical protein